MVQAIAIYKFDAAEENELSILKNEILEVVEKSDYWWTVRNKYGQAGLVPVAYIAAPIPDSDTVIVARGKTTKAHEAQSENELTVKKGQQVAIFDKTDNYWWFVGLMGETGYIPKKIINEYKKPGKTENKPKDDAVEKFGFDLVSPSEALCDDRTTILFSFQKPLPKGQFKVIFKGEHCEKVEEGERMNDFTLKTKTPKYYPAEKIEITINHQGEGQPEQAVAKNVDFLFHSKLDVVHKILSNESDPLNFLCSSFQIGDLQNVDLILSGNLEKKVPMGIELLKSSKSMLVHEQDPLNFLYSLFQIGDLQNVDHILSGNLKKKVPEGIEFLKSSKSVLVHEQVLPKETPTLLHFAAYYDLKKLAKALLKCPGAKEALTIKNCHGNGPVGVAKLRKNEEMEQLLQDRKANEIIDVGDEDEEMCMEKCYESYIEMGGNSPKYVVPNDNKRSQTSVDDEEEHDTPRPECEDRFAGYDGLNYNDNRIQKAKENEIQKQIDEYKVFGRMTEKEVQLALLMKRVKERYITQEQALEMVRVLRLVPQTPGRPPVTKKKPKVKKRGLTLSELHGKSKSPPRTTSTSSGSSVSSVGSSESGYDSDCKYRPVPASRVEIVYFPFYSKTRRPLAIPPAAAPKSGVDLLPESREEESKAVDLPPGSHDEKSKDVDLPPESHEEESKDVDLPPESQEEKSKNVDLPPESQEEKSKDVDLSPKSHEEKSKNVDLPPESHKEESKDVDLPPESQEEKGKDVDLPPKSQEEKSKDVDLPPESHEEESKDVDLPPKLQEEKSKDVDLPPESHEEESKDVDLPPKSYEEKSKDVGLPPESHKEESKDVDLPPESREEESKDVDLPPESHEEESKDVDLPPESHKEESKDVDLPPESQEEKSEDVDLPPESHKEESKDVDLPPESQEEESKDVDLPPESQEEESKDVDLPPESHKEESKDVDLQPKSHEEKSKDVDLPQDLEEESGHKFKDNASERIRQTFDNSIIITQEGGCFSLPGASAVFVFPSKAVKKLVTLTWSKANCKERGIKPREGEIFVSGILEIEPKEVKFEKPVTVFLSHSIHEDNIFRAFYELIVKDLSHPGSQELKTEHISSSKDIREELSNPNMLNDYLPAAKATITETCTLVVATRIKLHHISVSPNKKYTFSERFGENAELKITFSAGVTDEIQSLQVQLFPADTVLKKDVHLDNNLICAPVIKVTGQTTPFLKAVDVELTYSNHDIADIEDNFLPVGKKSKFTDDCGLMLRSQKSKPECEILNGSNLYIERPRKDQLKFLFSVKHFCKVCAIVKKNAGHQLNANNSVFNSSPLLNIVFDAVVLAIHSSQKSTLYTILAPSSERAALKNKWMIDPSGLGPKLKVGELVYFCVPLEKREEQEDGHMHLDADKFTFNETTIQSLLNQTKTSDCQKWTFMYFLHKRCTGNNHGFERDGFHNVEIHSSKKEHNKPVIETSPTISGRPAGNCNLFTQEDTGNDTFQNEVKTDPCQWFEEAVKEKFLEALGVNKNAIKNPKDGKIVEVIQNTGTITTVVLGVGLGTTICLNIPTLGIPAVVGAAALLTTFSVTKGSGYYKKKKAKNLDKKIEMILDFELKGIIIHVAKELSRIYEYQIREMKNLTDIRTLADCAVKLMLDLNNDDKFNVNTLIRKVLKDGKAKNKDLLTRNNVKWSSPDVFRKCGLLVTNVETKHSQFIYKVKPGCERDTAKYGYRGEFLEWKEFGHENKHHERASEEMAAQDEDKIHTPEQLCKCCSNNEDCTSDQCFGKSDIDSEYKDIQMENRPFYPTRILIKCPNVLNSFSQRQDKESSLANFLKNKLNLNGHEQVFPVYRPHSTEKVRCLCMSDLTGSDFSRSDFTDSCFQNCNFTDCVMLNTTLTRAKMCSSKFCRTFIFCSNLKGVDASFSKFGETNIFYSHLDMMDIRGIHMFGNLSWHGSNLEKTKKFKDEEINENEVLAEGTTPPLTFLHRDTHEPSTSRGINGITENRRNIDLNENLYVTSDIRAGHYEGMRTLPNCSHGAPVQPSIIHETTFRQNLIPSHSEPYPSEKTNLHETSV